MSSFIYLFLWLKKIPEKSKLGEKGFIWLKIPHNMHHGRAGNSWLRYTHSQNTAMDSCTQACAQPLLPSYNSGSLCLRSVSPIVGKSFYLNYHNQDNSPLTSSHDPDTPSWRFPSWVDLWAFWWGIFLDWVKLTTGTNSNPAWGGRGRKKEWDMDWEVKISQLVTLPWPTPPQW